MSTEEMRDVLRELIVGDAIKNFIANSTESENTITFTTKEKKHLELR